MEGEKRDAAMDDTESGEKKREVREDVAYESEGELAVKYGWRRARLAEQRERRESNVGQLVHLRMQEYCHETTYPRFGVQDRRQAWPEKKEEGVTKETARRSVYCSDTCL